MKNVISNIILDAKGLACPMPIVKTKKAMDTIEFGQVLEVHATDKGSKADMKAWAENSGHYYLGTIENEGVLKHYLRKSSTDDTKERRHQYVITNEELVKKLDASADILVLDVREQAEFAFNHIPNAISLPLGDLDEEMIKLDKEAEIFLVCHTGNRGDLAAQKLVKNGFTNVINVIPGMSKWTGKTAGINDERI